MADSTTTPEEKVEAAIAQPKDYEVDGEKVSTHSLPDMIAAAKYVASAKVGSNPFRALRIAKISTQGAER